MQINSRIKQKYDTLANWISNDIVLFSGELAVVDCGNQTRFKIGNGISSFNQLPFVDQNQLCTIALDAHNISQGTQAHSTPFGLAAGWRLSANANYSQAFGFKSETSVGHDFSFAWNGDDNSYSPLGDQYYTSHGKGSFNINPLSGLSGFYVGEKNLADILDSNAGNKITIDDQISGISGRSDLSIVKLDADAYAELLTSDQLLSNSLYVVQDDHVDAYGQQLKNLAAPTDLSDAANKKYVDNTISNSLSDFYQKSETSSAIEISSAFASIDTGNKVFIDDRISGIFEQTDLSIVHLSSSEYEQLSSSGQLLSNALYIVEDSFTNNYGKQIKNVATPTLSSDAATKNYVDVVISSIYIPTDLSAFTNSPGYLVSNDVKISYSNQTIWLSSKSYVTSVDCADFIKDGMLSTVELCGTTLVMKFNTESGSDPISVELSNFVDNYDDKINALSDAIDYKIFVSNNISGISGYSDLSVIKLSADEYASLLTSDQLLSNVLYVVQNDHIDAYGQQIKNVAAPADLSDAVNKEYVDNIVSNSLSDFYKKSETSSAVEINNALTSIDAGNKIFIDDQISGISGRSDLSVVKLDAADYASMLTSDSLLSNALYVVEDDHIDAYGEQIKNVAAPIDLSDATNKEYVDNTISNSLSSYYQKSETSSSIEISNAFASIDTGNKIFIDDRISSISEYSDLSVVKLSASEYATLLTSDSLLSNSLYVVQDDHIDAYGQQIKNVDEPTLSSDAATKNYVDYMISASSGPYRYPLVNANMINDGSGGLSCQIVDHAITTVPISSGTTPITIQFPPQQDDGARDFILRVEISSSVAPTVVFKGVDDEQITYDSDDSAWYIMQPGVNLISFTETK